MLALLNLARLGIAAITGRAGLAVLGTAAALDIGPFGGAAGVVGRPRRRRRRRALSAADREDLLFLSSLMTKAGIERVSAVLVARG